jgi:hypothetical protein
MRKRKSSALFRSPSSAGYTRPIGLAPQRRVFIGTLVGGVTTWGFETLRFATCLSATSHPFDCCWVACTLGLPRWRVRAHVPSTPVTSRLRLWVQSNSLRLLAIDLTAVGKNLINGVELFSTRVTATFGGGSRGFRSRGGLRNVRLLHGGGFRLARSRFRRRLGNRSGMGRRVWILFRSSRREHLGDRHLLGIRLPGRRRARW